MDDPSEQLTQLVKLRADGALTEEEFKTLKAKIIYGTNTPTTENQTASPIPGRSAMANENPNPTTEPPDEWLLNEALANAPSISEELAKSWAAWRAFLAALFGLTEDHARGKGWQINNAVLFVGVAVVTFIAGLAFGPGFGLWSGGSSSNLPSCNTSSAISDVNATLANAPAGKLFGIKIIDLQNASETSHSPTEVKCVADVKLNSGVEGKLQYRFYIENGRMFVAAQLPTAFTLPQEQKTSCRASLDQYQRVVTAMSYNSVRQIMGCDGKEMSRSDAAGYSTVMYEWSGETSSFGAMTVMFQNDRLVNKSQFGLK